MDVLNDFSASLGWKIDGPKVVLLAELANFANRFRLAKLVPCAWSTEWQNLVELQTRGDVTQ